MTWIATWKTAGSALTTVDLSIGTVTDTNSVFAGTTSWGTTSTVDLNCNVTATQLGAGFNLVNIGARPANARFLRLVLTCTMVPGSNPNNGGIMGIGAVCSKVAAPTVSGDGAYSGFAIDSADNVEFFRPRSLGSSPVSATALAGNLTSEVLFAIEGDGFDGIAASAVGATSGSAGEAFLTGAVSPFNGSVFVGISGTQSDGTPTVGTVSWGNVQLSYDWLEGE